ncbi:hypothetical protein [Streptosporangium sp. NPDC051022]|uniref:hypothetical protein n=1 Tax=Streptosporangium sp. NPDC051022 TaxID=3155752 RepID=UPI003429C17A
MLTNNPADADDYTVSVRVGDRVRHVQGGRPGTVTGDAEPASYDTGGEILGSAYVHWDGTHGPGITGVAVSFLTAA